MSSGVVPRRQLVAHPGNAATDIPSKHARDGQQEHEHKTLRLAGVGSRCGHFRGCADKENRARQAHRNDGCNHRHSNGSPGGSIPDQTIPSNTVQRQEGPETEGQSKRTEENLIQAGISLQRANERNIVSAHQIQHMKDETNDRRPNRENSERSERHACPSRKIYWRTPARTPRRYAERNDCDQDENSDQFEHALTARPHLTLDGTWRSS